MQYNQLINERISEIKEVAENISWSSSAAGITLDLIYLKKLAETSLLLLKKKTRRQQGSRTY